MEFQRAEISDNVILGQKNNNQSKFTQISESERARANLVKLDRWFASEVEMLNQNPIVNTIENLTLLGGLAINSSSVVIAANEKAHEILGFSSGELFGKPFNYVINRSIDLSTGLSSKKNLTSLNLKHHQKQIDKILSGKEIIVSQIDRYVKLNKRSNISKIKLFYISDPVHKIIGVFFFACEVVSNNLWFANALGINSSQDRNNRKSVGIERIISNTEALSKLKGSLTNQIKSRNVGYKLKKSYLDITQVWQKMFIGLLIATTFSTSIADLFISSLIGGKLGGKMLPTYDRKIEEIEVMLKARDERIEAVENIQNSRGRRIEAVEDKFKSFKTNKSPKQKTK